MPKLVTVEAMASALGVSRATLRREVRIGRIPAVRVGRQIRFDVLEVKKALAGVR